MPKAVKTKNKNKNIEMLDVTINRRKWLRNRKNEEIFGSALLQDGKMCCLGFVALACGFKEDDIADVDLPNNVYTEDPGFKPHKAWKKLIKKFGENSKDTLYLANVNDSYDLKTDSIVKYSATEREQLISERMKKMGINVKFTG